MTEQTEAVSTEPFETLYNSIQEASFLREEKEGFVFDLGEEQHALVTRDDFSALPTFEQGATATLLVERPYGAFWAASIRKAGQLALWDRVQELERSGEAISGEIIGENRGGLSVDIGLRAFLPMSQVDIHRVDDFGPYIGQKYDFRVTKFDHERGNVVVSRRVLLEEARVGNRDELIASLEPGQEFDGVIRNLVPFGAFVDIGGIEGLLHKSNMSWGRLDQAETMFRAGDPVRVVVLDYDPSNDRLSLGYKQLQSDPWEGISDNMKEGEIVDGKVVSLAEFGAFVELAEGLEGLVHVTELNWLDRINHPKEVLSVGEEIKVKVVGVDADGRRLSLSIKQLQPNPWAELVSQVPVGEKITGKVSGLVDFGVFVEVAPKIEGLVHVSDISWTERIDSPEGRFELGQEIDVLVLEVDADAGRVSLGIKQLSEDPWAQAAAIAQVGKRIDVRITRTTEFGAFAEIVDGIEGLIHVSELAEERVNQASDIVKPNQEVKVLVMSFDRANQRISLSLKREELEENTVREFVDDSGASATLGDIFRDRLGLSSSEEE